MPRLLYTVQNLVDEVRAQLDEANRDSVSTEEDILPSLNRAQDYAFDILARRYPEPLLRPAALTLVGGTADYDIPEDVFEDRVLKLDIEIPNGAGRNTYREVQQISYRDLATYESSSLSASPYYFAVFGRTIRFVPTPSGAYSARLWSLRNPEKLMIPQGRITRVNTGSNYVIVDTAGSSLTTESDQLGSYVNIIDGQTGEVKGSFQIATLSDNRLTFRTVPTRATVLNRTILGSIASLEIAEDDYVSPVDGTCVPYYGRPISNFLVQFSVAEITRSLGGSADMEERVLEKFEKQVERTWAGRETTLRIRKRSQSWGVPARRSWWD